MNSSGKVSEVFELPLYNRAIRIISMSVIFALALIGNLAVLHKICCNKSRRRKIDFLIINLAMADLCVSKLTLLTQIIWEVLEGEWLAGDLACRFFKVFQVFGPIASSSIIALIALERHQVIVNPLDPPLPTKILTAISWMCAFVLSIPQAFVYKLSLQEDREKCLSTFGQLPKWHFQTYIVFGAITVFFAPFCTLCVAYARILWTIRRKKLHIENCKTSENTEQKQQRRPIRIIATNSSIPRAKVKTLKMTLLIIILFIVCGLPYFIIEMKVAFGAITKTDTKVIAVLGIFMLSNSAVNPYVYLFFKTNNVYLSRLEKNVCFVCLKDYRENTFHRELCAIGKRVEHSGTTTSEADITIHTVPRSLSSELAPL
ncbi:putative G-protein coupled receptor 150 [Mustelus asterias]